jgi:predicted nucleic acid-binding protein
MSSGLHGGERACLAIAGARTWLLLTDDRAARAEARRRKIDLSGSLGCLVLGVERKLFTLEQANALLAMMVAQGYHAPLTDISELVRSDAHS